MNKVISLSWNDRFALIEHYKATDVQVLQAFGVTQDELNVARDLKEAGTFSGKSTIDVSSYSHLFTGVTAQSKTATSTKRPTATASSQAPQTATKKSPTAKKRGRQGIKIANAFKAIPGAQVPAQQFASQHGVSLAVLRQSKRFDKHPELGIVKVKKDKTSQTLMIWREPTVTN